MMAASTLPDLIKPFFWDSDTRALSWAEHRDFIIRRILQTGTWEALSWLRNELGDDELRLWIEKQRGGGLSPRQMRFWQVVLDLPPAKVTRWVHLAAIQPWERRLTR